MPSNLRRDTEQEPKAEDTDALLLEVSFVTSISFLKMFFLSKNTKWSVCMLSKHQYILKHTLCLMWADQQCLKSKYSVSPLKTNSMCVRQAPQQSGCSYGQCCRDIVSERSS